MKSQQQRRPAALSAPAHNSKKYFIVVSVFALIVLLGVTKLFFVSTPQSTKQVLAAPQIRKQTKIVCIDPGHGGNDPGAQANNLTEATLNLQVSFLVRTMLQAKGYPVYMTRTTDTSLSHAQRAQYCNAHNATILVAIHQNSYPYGNADYSTALYYKPQDLALATAMANAAGKTLNLSVSAPSYFVGGVLMHSTMPATLIESLFITNTTEASGITTGSRLTQQAQGIVNGIVNYLTSSK
jgi:N-acetylmuramoyl-L-alanine amidase